MLRIPTTYKPYRYEPQYAGWVCLADLTSDSMANRLSAIHALTVCRSIDFLQYFRFHAAIFSSDSSVEASSHSRRVYGRAQMMALTSAHGTGLAYKKCRIYGGQRGQLPRTSTFEGAPTQVVEHLKNIIHLTTIYKKKHQ